MVGLLVVGSAAKTTTRAKRIHVRIDPTGRLKNMGIGARLTY